MCWLSLLGDLDLEHVDFSFREAPDHIFSCTKRRSALHRQLKRLREWLVKIHTPEKVANILMVGIVRYAKYQQNYRGRKLQPTTLADHYLQNAVRDQCVIGWRHALCGRFSYRWAQAVYAYKNRTTWGQLATTWAGQSKHSGNSPTTPGFTAMGLFMAITGRNTRKRTGSGN